MLFSLFNFYRKEQVQETSKLFDDQSFYQKFLNDINDAKKEIIIESPFITSRRINMFRYTFERLIKRNVSIYIITRDPDEHSQSFTVQAEEAIRYIDYIGIRVFVCPCGHYRKLAIIDRKILREGSLNILSQGYSREIMRRIDGKRSAEEMFNFLHFGRFIDSNKL